MEKFDYSREESAGDMGSKITVQGSFNADGKSKGKPGIDSGLAGKMNGNEALNVAFPKKGEGMVSDNFTTMSDQGLYFSGNK